MKDGSPPELYWPVHRLRGWMVARFSKGGLGGRGPEVLFLAVEENEGIGGGKLI